MRLLVLFITLAFLIPASVVSAEVSPKQVLKQYFAISSKLFPPQLEMSIDERVSLTKKREAFWHKKRNSNKDFLFIKQNAKFPFTIKELTVEDEGHVASMEVIFTPDKGSLVAAAPMYMATSGIYEMRRDEEWKLVAFKKIITKQKRPVGPSASIEDVLSGHHDLLASIYPPDKSKLPQNELISTRAKISTLWVKKRASASQMRTDKVPSFFYDVYKPTVWKILDLNEDGNSAVARIEMAVGSENQIRLNRGGFTRQVEYSLVRKDGEWYISAFQDITALAEGKVRVEADQQAAVKKQKLAVAAPGQDGGGREMLDAYFKQLQNYYPPGSNAPPGNPMIVADETQKFWKMDNRKARSSHARSMSIFMLFRPTDWTVKDFSQSGDTATARVSFTIGVKRMIKLNKGSPTKSANYTLKQVAGKWLITGFDADR